MLCWIPARIPWCSRVSILVKYKTVELRFTVNPVSTRYINEMVVVFQVINKKLFKFMLQISALDQAYDFYICPWPTVLIDEIEVINCFQVMK